MQQEQQNMNPFGIIQIIGNLIHWVIYSYAYMIHLLFRKNDMGREYISETKYSVGVVIILLWGYQILRIGVEEYGMFTPMPLFDVRYLYILIPVCSLLHWRQRISARWRTVRGNYNHNFAWGSSFFGNSWRSIMFIEPLFIIAVGIAIGFFNIPLGSFIALGGMMSASVASETYRKIRERAEDIATAQFEQGHLQSFRETEAQKPRAADVRLPK